MISEAPATSSFGSGPSTPTTASTSAPVIIDPTAVRGYDAHSIPPDVDPLLELFTNLLMKHGRKAEAEGRVSRILSLL
jgi:small subunit ribosomal protein S7